MNLSKEINLFLVLCISIQSFAQEKVQELDSIIINSTRISIPFKKNSRTINIITAKDIKNSAATNVADLLQQVAGVDIRRRGTGGGQSDLYIRGGGFDQTLLLIDGIKMDDAQTGHHTMNAVLPIEVIERIEIIKGPAARIFGQNAFTGAINIVTKKRLKNKVSINVETGSFGQLNSSVTLGKETENSSVIAHVGALTSDGYRNNSDYNNQNYFLKGIFNKNKQPIEIIATFFDKKFGAQNFYTTNLTFNERFAKDLKIISALKQWEFGIGATAREIEKKALSKFSSVRVRNLKILKSHGNTELFEQDILPELMDLVESY